MGKSILPWALYGQEFDVKEITVSIPIKSIVKQTLFDIDVIKGVPNGGFCYMKVKEIESIYRSCQLKKKACHTYCQDTYLKWYLTYNASEAEYLYVNMGETLIQESDREMSRGGVYYPFLLKTGTVNPVPSCGSQFKNLSTEVKFGFEPIVFGGTLCLRIRSDNYKALSSLEAMIASDWTYSNTASSHSSSSKRTMISEVMAHYDDKTIDIVLEVGVIR